MSNTSSLFRTADLLAGGHLAETLQALSADGLSYSAIASRLYASFNIDISTPTVGLWLRRLAEADSEATA